MDLASSFQHNHHKINVYRRIYMRFIADEVIITVRNREEKWQSVDIKPLCQDGPLKVVMERKSIPIELNSFDSLLKACTDTQSVNQVHAQIVVSGYHQSIYLATRLVTMCAQCSSMGYARQVFDKTRERNEFLWNALIRGYVMNGLSQGVFDVYNQMQRSEIQANNFTYSSVLKACAELSALQEGRELHNHVVKAGLESDIFVGNALVAMYAKCKCVEIARKLFDKMSERDAVSWNAMIAAYSQNGYAADALALFRQMQTEGIMPTPVTMGMHRMGMPVRP